MEPSEARQLPLRVEIDSAESALGFALRALRANGIDFKVGMRWLGLIRVRRTSESHARRLAWQLNTDPESFCQRLILADTAYLWIQLAGHRMMRYAVAPSHYAKLCPLCVREKPIARLEWLLRLTVGCARHGYSLLMSCQQCGQKIGWDRPDVDICRCGYPFKAAAEVAAMEPDVQAWTDWLEHELLPQAQLPMNSRKNELPAVLTHMSIDGAFRVIEALGLLDHPGQAVRSARDRLFQPKDMGAVIARGVSRLREIEADPSAASRLSAVVHHGTLVNITSECAAAEDRALAQWLLDCLRIAEPGPTRAGIRPKGQLPLFLR